MSTRGIEDYSDTDFKALLVREGILEFTGGRRHVQAIKVTDDAGQEMWSVNVVISDEKHTFVVEKLAMQEYSTTLN